MKARLRAFRKEHVGRPVDFKAYDGETYNGHLVAVLPRGVHIRYYVTSVSRECDSHLPTIEAKQRVAVL